VANILPNHLSGGKVTQRAAAADDELSAAAARTKWRRRGTTGAER